ncbi:alpha/beta hydrolase fold domain-containing protein [Microbacterium sp. RD1]|uniref:alpha/beta hydrolase fold domain-containing protein n=1 Tax=Microbacterium sp. RD1 TaxID=3457313 RepID=UPI003FA5A266
MDIIIIGGGVGGLAAAIALHRGGARVTVLEQAPELSSVGAGINISANGMKALRWLGADADIRASSVYSQGATFRSLGTGEQISSLEFGARGESLWGESFYHAMRADIIDALLRQLPPGALRLNARVVAVTDRGDTVDVRLDSGDVLTADAVVGADGLRSGVRAALFGESDAEPTGYVAWRALIDLERAPDLGVTPASRNWVGPSRHIITYPVANARYLNFVGFVPDDELGTRESWMASGDTADLRRSFSDACADVTAIIDAIDTAFITAIHYRAPLPTWSRGNLALLGDAAHPVPPSAAQGACMALEDAVVLGLSYARHAEEGFAAVVSAYEARRQPRTNRLFGTAMQNFRTFNQGDPAEVHGRNGRLRGLQTLDPESTSTWGWIYGYDVAADLDGFERLDGLMATSQVNTRERPAARAAFESWAHALSPADFIEGDTGLRAGYRRFLAAVDALPGALDRVVLAGPDSEMPAEILASGDPVLVHLHGGLFSLGSAASSAAHAQRLAEAVGGVAVVAEYRLAPENPFPAASDDVLAVYRRVRAHATGPVLLSGVDAGAGLALGLAVAARDEGLAMPDGILAVSPFVDLSLSSPSIDANAGYDPWVSRQFLALQAAGYLHAHDPRDPRISPLFADLHALPPLVILAADDEALADDARRLAAAAQEAGVDVRLTLVADSVHALSHFPALPESAAALDAVRQLTARKGVAARP